MGSESVDTEGERRRGARQRDAFPWVCFLALLFFLGNSTVAVYTARDDPWEVAFVAVVSVTLISLFVALAAYDRIPPEDASRRRRNLRVLIWALATALNFAFACRVAEMMPAAVSLAIWGMAAFVPFAGIWLLLLGCPDDSKASGGGFPKTPLLDDEV